MNIEEVRNFRNALGVPGNANANTTLLIAGYVASLGGDETTMGSISNFVGVSGSACTESIHKNLIPNGLVETRRGDRGNNEDSRNVFVSATRKLVEIYNSREYRRLA